MYLTSNLRFLCCLGRWSPSPFDRRIFCPFLLGSSSPLTIVLHVGLVVTFFWGLGNSPHFLPFFFIPFSFSQNQFSDPISLTILFFLPFLLVWMTSQNIGTVSPCLNKRGMISVSIRIAAQRSISLQQDF